MAEERAGNQNKLGKAALTVHTPLRLVAHKYGPLSFNHNLSWRVHLLEADALPSLESIRSSEVRLGKQKPGEIYEVDYGFETVKLDYRVTIDLIIKSSNLEYWGCRTGDDGWTRK
jgi:hypothetical protein